MKHNFLKTLVIGLITVLTFTGCCSHENTRITEIDHPDTVKKFEYEGHKYIMFEVYGTVPRNDMTGIVHDPDCPCHNNK